MLYTIKYNKKAITKDFKTIDAVVNYITDKIKASAIIENLETKEQFEYIEL